MEPNQITKYAVLNSFTVLRLHASAEVPSAVDQTLQKEGGTLLKVFQTQVPGNASSIKFSTVQVMDFVNRDPIYENLYECPQTSLQKVSEDFWPYVISIADPSRRLRLVQNQDLRRFVIYLKRNDLVSVCGEPFGRAANYATIVRYIGPVEELHPVGYFFGLELLHLDSGHSPQSEDIPFAIKYMQCDPALSIFATADCLAPLPSEVKKKFSALDLINGTLEKVRTAIGPSICTSESSTNTTSLRRGRKSKKKEPTAQFYDLPSSPNKGEEQQSQLTPFVPVKEVPQSASAANMERKMHAGSASSFDAEPQKNISLECDEFTRSIKNYEKSLERQHASSANPDSKPYIPSAQTQAPAGILKHRRISSNSASTSATAKPTTIMSLDDRDIIVIDKADIRESTKNENSVIVLENPRHQEVDLADLLGGNWPNTAGDAASMLNKGPQLKPQPHLQQDQKGLVAAVGSGSAAGSSNSSVSSLSQTARAERIKSPNPLSHFTPLQTQHSREALKPAAAPEALSGSETIKENNEAASVAAPVNFDADYSRGEASLAAQEEDFVQSSPLQEVPGNAALGVGSMVEVSLPEVPEDLYGVIRWIGVPPGAKIVMVGVELEDDPSDKQLHTTDGCFNGVPLFRCHEGRALFVAADRCASDRRFVEVDGAGGTTGGKANLHSVQRESKMFGQVECPSVPGAVAPLKISNIAELEEFCGKFKGIQGHHNSCYLDATLFSMFTFTPVFDSLLFRPPEPEDIPHYADVQKVLREEIVNPLRKNVFVRADRVMKLRQLLDQLSSVSGLTSEEKDPEEFLNSLLAQIMRVEPFLKLSSGQDAYFYQLFVEKDDRLSMPTVQQLFEQSFHSSDIKLKEVPSCLIIQMPRFGKNYKMYPRILPSQVLDVTDIIEDSPRQCSVCGKLAEFECRDCFGILQGGLGLESTAFCRKCLETVHMHAKRINHTSRKLSVPQDFKIMAEHMTVPRLYMELFAVVCIETSHYVAFVKAGSGPDAPWCFFDSMADRKGEQNGYNIPEMITVPDLPLWLSEEGARTVNETSSNDKMLPEHAKRLFCDAYMCMYQSTDVMMYR